CAERVQRLRPQSAVSGEPGVHLGQRLRPEPVEAVLRLRLAGGETGVAKHPKVPGHGRLGDAGLGLYALGDLACGSLAVRKQLDDAPPDRVAEDVEPMHRFCIRCGLYNFKLMNDLVGHTAQMSPRSLLPSPSALTQGTADVDRSHADYRAWLNRAV